MNTNVTPEVASAHRNLEELCEKFETSVDKFCALSPQSIRPHEFYECECVPIAAACADALSEFQSAQSYEVTAYEKSVAEAENELRQQKHRLEEDTTRSKKIYENAVAEAENELRQQKRRFEEGAAQRTRTYENTVAEVDKTYHELKSELESDVHRNIQDIENEVRGFGVDFTFSQEKTTVTNHSKIPYNLALERFNRVLVQDSKVSVSEGVKNWVYNSFYLFLGLWPFGGCGLWLYRSARDDLARGAPVIQSYKDAFFPFVIISIVPTIIAIIFSIWKHNKKPRALRALKSAAQTECNTIFGEMEKVITNASAERGQKVKEAQSRKETEDKQAAEAEAEAIPLTERDMNAKIKEAQAKKEREEQQAAEAEAKALTVRDKKVEEARSGGDLALAYIGQEYQVYDSRFCQCLDKFEQFVEVWTTENAVVTSVLNENRVQNLSKNSERSASGLIRVGTVKL